MHKYLLLLVILTSAAAANCQSVFNSGDPTIAYNSGAAVGSPTHPDTPATGAMVKWVRTRNTGRIPWDDSKFKCYHHSNMSFRLRYPQNYDSTKKYPCIIFFHGAGESSTNIYENEDQLFWGAQTFQNLITSGQFNGFLLFPQQAGAGWDNNWFPRVNDILDSLSASKGLDADRVITMGLSEGGYGSILMASLYPTRVAGIVSTSPITVGIINNVPNYIHVPVYVANGGQDGGPTPSEVNTYFANFHSLGGNIFQSYYMNQGHNVWGIQWGQTDPNNNDLMLEYWNNSHKAQPLLFYQGNEFCAGSPISAKMGISAGFYAYQWQWGVNNGSFSDIPGATGNEYTATQTGSYRVHFKRFSTSNWSDWTPSPIKIVTKPCSLDTLFAEHFNYDDPNAYQYFGATTEYKRYNFGCQNGVYTTGTESFTNDATGKQGARFSLNYTMPSASGNTCNYLPADKVWGMYQNQPTVKQNTNYLFSYYTANQTGTLPTAALVPSVNGTTLTTLLSKPTALPTTISGNSSWTKFTYLWNSGSATSADMALLNNNTNTSGNDFLLDEISFTRQLAPGGVGANMMLWNKADVLSLADSTKVVDWANASGGTQLVQFSDFNKPVLKNNSTDNINFNPLVNFSTSTDQYMLAQSGFAGTASHTAAHVFMVARSVDNFQTDSAVVERGNSLNNRLAISIPVTGNVVWDAGDVGSAHVQTPANAADLNTPILWAFSKDSLHLTASGNKQDIRKNGATIASSSVAGSVFTGNNANFKIGSTNVKVAELIYYLDANITAATQNRIESYLAIKYGMTLGTSLSPVNYTASDGTTIFWPGAQPGYANYHHDVFGIGVDSLSGLNQLSSNSINSGSGDGTGQVNKGNLILRANSGTLNDRNYLMIGNDSTTLAEHIITPGEAPSGVQTAKRVGREWKVINTGGVGTATLTFDTTGLTLAGGATLGNFALLMDSDGDGDFTTGTASLFYATSSTGKQISFSGVTLNNNIAFTIITQKPASSLPATWLGFTAQAVNGNALLNWQTSEEVNVDYYAVEHSTNGANFTVIGVKPANNGLGINDYSYTQQSLAAGTHYYRIRRVDRDGVYKYSEVKTIRISALSAVQIRPNPVTGSTLSLGISLQEAAQAVIQVVSIDGKVMLRTNTQLVQGVNTVNINVDAIPTGIYMVQVQMNNDAVTKKFIRTR